MNESPGGGAVGVGWRVVEGWQRDLSQLGIRNDVIKRLHQLVPGDPSRYRFLEPSELTAPVEGVVRRHQELGERSVDRCEAFLVDLLAALPRDLDVGPEAELAGEQVLSACPHVVLDVTRRDAQLLAVPVHPADDDVNVGMVGVVVVDGCPDEGTLEVLLHLREQLTGEHREVDLPRVLGRDDETKLPLLTLERRREGLAIEGVVRPVKSSGRPVSLNTIPLEVRQVQTGRAAAASEHRDVVRLDDTAARIGGRLADVVTSPRAPRRRCARTPRNRSNLAQEGRPIPRPSVAVGLPGPPANLGAEEELVLGGIV